jgi:hypothetical protein
MSERRHLRLLLDEHYPGWLAEDLAADGVEAVALTAHRPGLRRIDDRRVLEAFGGTVGPAGDQPGIKSDDRDESEDCYGCCH